MPDVERGRQSRPPRLVVLFRFRRQLEVWVIFSKGLAGLTGDDIFDDLVHSGIFKEQFTGLTETEGPFNGRTVIESKPNGIDGVCKAHWMVKFS